MAGTFLKWLVPGVITIIAGTALAASQTDATISSDLSARAAAALDPQQFGWAHVAISGRDAIITGTATSQAAIDSALDRVANLRGVRAVTSEVALAEFVSPFPFVATVKDGAIALSGGYPDETVHKALVAAAGKPTDSMHLASGAPAGFDIGAQFALGAATNLDQGEARLSDMTLTIEGRAKSPAAFDSLQRLSRATPASIQLAALKIVPPLVSPYVWTAKFDGKTVTIGGNAPASDMADQLNAVVPQGVPVSANMALASGEPSGFAANALTLLGSLLKLEQGEATIIDGAITLSGAPATAALAAEVTVAVTKLGGTVTLEPPRVDDFNLTVTKTGGKLRFAGVVPDAASRDKLAALRDADATGVSLARGAPDGFAPGLEFGLNALGHLAEGQFSIDGTTLQLTGKASSVSDFKATTALIEAGAPEGMRIASSDVHPPVADPFTWMATKADKGAIAISGFVPDAATKEALDAKAATASDTADPADGAPQGFAGYAAKGLDVLALLDSGTVKFDGTAWSIEGNVDSTKKGFAADAAYSAAGLRTAGWTYNVHLPTLPIIAPYVWRAEKSAGGVSFSGFAPSDEFKAAVKDSATGSVDTTVLGSGAPQDFEASADAGLTALMALDEGTLGLAGDRWTLTGTIADAAARDRIQSALSAKIDTGKWQVAIQARDAAPVASPYVWSATKDSGNIVLTGYLPSAALKAEAASLAGSVSTDNSAVASGEPTGFADDMRAGLSALSHLSDGKVSFDGSAWHLTGIATTQDESKAASEALQKGSKAGALWDAAIESEAAPSSSTEEASASSEVSSIAAPDVTSLEPTSSAPISSEPSSSAPMSSAATSSSETISSVSEEPSSAMSSSNKEASSSMASSTSSASSEVSSSEGPSLSSVEQSSSSSSEAPSSAAPSSEPVTASSSAVESSSSSSSSSASSEASQDREVAPMSLSVVPPMPDTFVFAAVRQPGGPIALAGSVPADATATDFATLAGGAKTDKLTVDADLPPDFAASGSAGIGALAELMEGRLGFDGSRWWLRGKTGAQATANDANAKVAALPNGSAWSVSIDVLAPLDVCLAKVDVLAKRNAIVFQAGKAALVAASLPILDELAADLAACPDTYVHVQGHTDADGDPDKNLVLSVSRAEMVVAELVKRGVSDTRFYAEGFGESDPIAPNDTKDGKAKNRRITFEITPE